jgi:EpsI family protein
VIDLPHYGMIVNQECSGLKLLVSLMMFAAFLGLIHVGAWWKKAVLLLCSLPLACAVNATRIAVSGILGECISARAGDRFHDCSGIYVWLMAILGFGLVVKVLRMQIWDGASRADETGFPARIGDPPSAQGRHWAFVAMLVVIAVGGLLTRQVAGNGLREAPGGPRLTPSDLPVTVGVWTSEAVVYPAETYDFYTGACIASRRYRRADGTAVDVMLVATHRREQVHTPVPCYECEGGVVRGSRSAELELDGRRVPVRRLWVRRGSTGRPPAWNEECVYWFQSGARAADDPVAIKAISAGRLLLGQIREPILCYQFACPTRGGVPNPALDPFVRELMRATAKSARRNDEHA